MRLLAIQLFLVSSFLTQAQSNQSEYLEAKRLFSEENYRDAMGGFQGLSDDPTFGAYATFYYALSAYHQELPKVALDSWKQIRLKYPKWDQLEEVNFWIAKTSFERKRYEEAVDYTQRLPEKLQQVLIQSVIDELDIATLKESHQVNRNNRLLASLYFQRLLSQPYKERDNETLLRLSNQFGFELDVIVKDLPIVKKEQYSIALVLPFMFDSLQNPQSVIRNRIIYELYQGMTLAADSLASQGINLSLYPFDTKKNRNKTRQILNRGSIENADVIIGPLYAEPNEEVVPYSKKQEIPMINPLSSNLGTIDGNGYAFLFKPSYETQGKIAGEYAKSKYQKNKNAMILFETERDMLVAEAYKKVLEEDSFNVVFFDELTKETGLKIQADFTEQFEQVLDTLSQREIDSIADLPGRFVRSRVLRDSITGRVIRRPSGDEVLQYYEMQFKIRKDTIGHIFAATSSNLLANNVISLAEVRGDSIGIIGYDNWLDFRLVSYSQLERLDISLIHTSCFKKDLREIEKAITKAYYAKPTEYHFTGFELIMQLGKLLEAHGKYFQRGLISGSYLDGYLMEGIKYGPFRDNQIVPIVKMENLELRVQNRDLYEN